MGGCTTMPGSCSSGFKSRPSGAAGNMRSNGFDVHNKNRIKPTLIRPSTPTTRANTSAGNCLLNNVTARVQAESMKAHSSSEPSCEPQVAAKRYCSGSCEFELLATLTTEKSLPTNDAARHAKANATQRNCARASGRASPINVES